MDWRIYRAIYGVSLHHHWVGTLFHAVEQASIPFMVVVTVALWLLARPGGSPKWKLAATTALGAAAVALAINKVISSFIWHRARPYDTHVIAHPWSNTHDASFPSDHTSASFAIAFAVLMCDPLAGALFLVFAIVIGAGRLFIGAHYPGDVGAGVLVGLAAALVVSKLLQPVIGLLVRLTERITDPILGRIWRLASK